MQPAEALPFDFPHREPRCSGGLVLMLSSATCPQPPSDVGGIHRLPSTPHIHTLEHKDPAPCSGAGGFHAHLGSEPCQGKKGLNRGGKNQRITGLLQDCPICHQHKDKPCLGLGCQRGAHHYIRTPLGETCGGKWQLSGHYHFSCNSLCLLLCCT